MNSGEAGKYSRFWERYSISCGSGMRLVRWACEGVKREAGQQEFVLSFKANSANSAWDLFKSKIV